MHERPVSEMQHQPIADKKDALFNAALDIANQAIDFFHADPTRFISSALTIAKIVIEKIQTAKANQEQLNYLCERIQTALPTLIRLKEDTAAAKQVKLPLLAFKTCLESCYAQAQKYADKHWFKKLIRAGADQQKFQTLALELNDSIAMLDVSLSVEQTVILEKIAHCQLEDKQQIMAKMESIMALEEASLREMKVLRHQHKQMHLEQSEFNVVIGEQLSAIPAAISKQLKLNGEEQTQFIHKQFAMLCKKFHSFEEKERCSTAPPIPAHLSIPYYDLTIDKILKEGSFGTIYLGDWFGITVAVKKIGNRIQGDDYKQFLNELKNLAKFRHPNIIQVYGACLEPEACIVTEYARNRSLVEFLENNKISSAEQVKIIKGLAHALRYLHELGGIHRDLNPSNVLIDEHGEPKLNDFGLSKVMSNTLSTVAHIHFDKRRSTHATSHLEWLSPELLTKGKKATSAADIYSFALIVIYLFTGKSIFQDLPVEKIAFDSLRLAAYKKVASQIPKEFRGLMIECLQPNPELRPEARDVSSNMVSICDQYLSRNSTSFDMLTEKGLHSPKQIYLKGKTLAQRGNNEESFVCIKRAAKAGYSRAQADLGVRLLTGKGCQTNKAKAYAWFMKARKQKHTRAIFNAATMLEYGDGVPLNKGLALKLYKEAQELGNPDAAQKVDELLKSGVNLPISKV